MNFFRAAWRTFFLLGITATAIVELVVMRPRTRQERADWLHRLCERALRRLGVVIDVKGVFPSRGAVISNHLSYLDIIVYAAIHRCVFVSKAEVGKWPVIGWMTTMSGTVYVERGHGGSAMRAREGMQETVDDGLPVVFFPEGTTSSGEGLLKFHGGLLSQALASGAAVTAAFVRYRIGEGNPPEMTVRDDVHYWGDGNMWKHIFRFMALKDVRAEVHFADGPIVFKSTAGQRKQAAAEACEAVKALGRMAGAWE